MSNPKPVLPDEPSVIGGKGIPDSLRMREVEDDPHIPQDELGFLAYSLMRLYPDKIPDEFAKVDLLAADDQLKGRLIDEMHRRLGVATLKSNVIIAP